MVEDSNGRATEAAATAAAVRVGAPKRILVPLDLIPAGEAKLPIAESQARAFGAEMILLHVMSERAASLDGVTQAEAHARAFLDAVALRLRSDGIVVQTLVRYGSVASTVLGVAREMKADLIIIGTNMRGGLSRLFPGAIADEIVHNAPCPVLLVRPALETAPPAPPVRSFVDDAAKAGPVAPRSLGARTVELARVIGSVGRPGELGADFRPLKPNQDDENRLKRLAHAMEQGLSLPPVELYKLGYGYYVLDGHHRVAIAKQNRQLWLDAVVTEYVPLSEPEAQRIFTERQRFERATGLTRIGMARPGSYARLEELIHELAEQHDIKDLRDAARRWYAEVFRPAQLAVRARRLTQYFPGERTADVVLRLEDHRRLEAQRLGKNPQDFGWREALETFRPDALRAESMT
jgi:nucleotide-binding universal stress UspA family protein